jgi:hypothetical protein
MRLGGPSNSIPCSAATPVICSKSGGESVGGGSVRVSAGRPIASTNRSNPAGELISRTRACLPCGGDALSLWHASSLVDTLTRPEDV